MTDNPATLVERLRSKQRLTKGNSRIDTWRLYGQSADEIESLQSRNAELEGALTEKVEEAVYQCMMILDQSATMSIGEMMDAMRDLAPGLKSSPDTPNGE